VVLCLSSGALVTVLATQAFTLAWVHSIEKVRWEEDWQVAGGKLQIVEARIRGTGAGMETPEGAVLSDGAWHYRPQLAPLAKVTLAHSPYTAGYELCSDGRCRPLTDHLPGIAATGTIVLAPCRRGAAAG